MAMDMQAVHILAKQAALRVVKRKLQAEGKVKPSLVPAGRLGILANEYLQAHPELFAQAIQSDLVQISPVPHKRRKLDPQRELLCESRDRVSAMIYARVSTDGQTLDAQLAALRQARASKVYSEKISGTVTERKALTRAIAELGPGDCLLVTRLDRLARSTRDLLNVLDQIAKAGASFRSLADSWADTSTPHGKLIVTVLGGLAEFERSLILARTSEGRARAKARGVKFGRKPSLTPHQRSEALVRRAAGEALTEIAWSYAVSHSTISRLA